MYFLFFLLRHRLCNIQGLRPKGYSLPNMHIDINNSQTKICALANMIDSCWRRAI